MRSTFAAIILTLMVPGIALGSQGNLFQRAIAENGAKPGGFLASAPKVRPDDELYHLSGRIRQAADDNAFFASLSPTEENELLANALRRSRGMGNSTDYFAVVIPPQLEEYYLKNAQIGGGFDLIGRYALNTEYQTVSGKEMQAPVFEAVYLDLWSNRQASLSPLPPPTSTRPSSPPLTDYERCIEGTGGAMPAMIECSTAEAIRQDARLNAAYKRAMAAAPNKADLRSRQRDWIKERDGECAADSSGGQAATLNTIECEIRMSSQRADELEAMI